MSADRIGDWIQTASGKQFFPLDPRSEEVHIEDVAHHLANMCRFTGATRTFYSVAEHSVRVSHVVRPEKALAGLLHDASEAYLVDLPRPLKRSAAFADAYHAAERAVTAAVGKWYGLLDGYAEDEDVERADVVLLLTEKRDLMSNPPIPWRETGIEPLVGKIVPWSPRAAHLEFLQRFYELTNAQITRDDVLRIVERTRTS